MFEAEYQLKIIASVSYRGRFLSCYNYEDVVFLILMLGTKLKTDTKNILIECFNDLLGINGEKITGLIYMEFKILLNSN